MLRPWEAQEPEVPTTPPPAVGPLPPVTRAPGGLLSLGAPAQEPAPQTGLPPALTAPGGSLPFSYPTTDRPPALNDLRKSQTAFIEQRAQEYWRTQGINERVFNYEDAEAARWYFDQYQAGGEAWAEAQSWLDTNTDESGRKTAFPKVVADFEEFRESLLKTPMQAFSRAPDATFHADMLRVLEHPQGWQAVEAIAELTGDPEMQAVAYAVRNTTNVGLMAHLYQQGGVGQPYDEGTTPISMSSLAVEGIKWGDEALAGRRKVMEAQANTTDPRMVVPVMDPGMPEVDWYQAYALQMSQMVERTAAELGLDYEAVKDQPANVGEAKKVFEGMMWALQRIDEQRIEQGAGRAHLVGGVTAKQAFITMGRTVQFLIDNLPEDESLKLEEVQDVFAKLATGEISGDTEMPGGTNLVFSFLDFIGRPDKALAMATVGGAKKVAPRFLRFDDGYVTDNPMEATKHYLDLLDKGALDAANPEAAMIAEQQRLVALAPFTAESFNEETGQWERGDRGNSLFEWGGFLGESITSFAAGVSTGWATLLSSGSDDVWGPPGQERPLYAQPVAYVDQVAPRTDGGAFSRGASALLTGEGQYMTEMLVEQTLTGANLGYGHKFMGWTGSLALEVLTSPYNFMHTGAVRADAVTKKSQAILERGVRANRFSPEFEEIARESLDAAAKMTKAEQKAARAGGRTSGTWRFQDGAEMAEEWAAAAQAITQRFGKGAKAAGLEGGPEEIASLFLTTIRDNPGKNFDEIVRLITNEPKWLDEFAHKVQDTGWGDDLRIAMTGGKEATRNYARRLFDEALGDVRFMVEQTVLNTGARDLASATRRAALMENSRGIFMGSQSILGKKMGISLTGVRRVWEAYGRPAIDWLETAEGSALRRTTGKLLRKGGATARNTAWWVASGFNSNYWTVEGLGAKGGLFENPLVNTIGHVERIPWRMRRMFEEKFRRRIAAATQVVDAEVTLAMSRQLDDGSHVLLDKNDRIMVAIAVELGADDARTTTQLFDSVKREQFRGILPDTWIAGSGTTERMFEHVWEQVENVRILHDRYAEGLTAMGILDADLLVKDGYITRFYRSPDAAKRIRENGGIAEMPKSTAASVEAPGQKQAQHTKGRVGPVDIFEAMRLGYEPELDMLQLLGHRSMAHYEEHAKAAFVHAIAATYGRPMMKGREAVLHVTEGAKQSRWAKEDEVFQASEEVKEYGMHMRRISQALSHKGFLRRKNNLTALRESLGLTVTELVDEAALVANLPRSEKFLRLAASGRKNVLDGFLPESLRGAIRDDARELLALRKKRQASLDRLREVSPDLPLWSTVIDEDMGAIAKALRDQKDKNHAAATRRVDMDSADPRPWKEVDTDKKRVEDLTKRLRETQKSTAYFVAEAKVVRDDLKALNKEREATLKAREPITTEWDRIKARLGEAGYNADGLSSAQQIEDVRRGDMEVAASHRADFARYKKLQEKYRENFHLRKNIEAEIARMEGEASKALVNVQQARNRVNRMRESIKEIRRAGKERRTARVQTQKQKRKAVRKLDKAIDDFIRHHEAVTEVSGRMSAMHGTNSFREGARMVSEYSRRTARFNSAINARVNAAARRFGLHNFEVKRRARMAEELPESVDDLRRNKVSPEEEIVRMGERARAAARGYGGKVGRLRPNDTAYPRLNEGNLERYQQAEDTLRSLDITGEELNTALWHQFGARNITDVPIHELEVFADRAYVKFGRTLMHPADPEGRLVGHIVAGNNKAMERVEAALGLKSDAAWNVRAERVDEALDELFAKVEAGDEEAIKTLKSIRATDIAELYVPNSVGDALRTAINEGIMPGKQFAVLGASEEKTARSPLLRQLSNTYIPAELAMTYRAMIGEGILTNARAGDFVLANAAAGLLGGFANIIRGATRGWKVGVTYGQANMQFGRRNLWFDGARTVMALGLWDMLDPSVYKAFRREMARTQGVMNTATGPLDLATFHEILRTQGITTIAMRTDDVQDFAATISKKAEDAQRARSDAHAEAVLKESTRKKGTGFAPGGIPGAIAGAVFGDMIGLGAGAGAMAGHQAGAAIQSIRRPAAHTAGNLATPMDWLLPVGPHAAERGENTFRAFAMWAFVKGGMSPQMAVNKVNGLLRDYSNLTRAEHKAIGAFFGFYNFTKQNAKAQFLRLMESPSRATFFARLFRGISEDEKADNPDFMNAFNSIVRDGKVWFVSDELEAMVSWAQPAVDLVVNRSGAKAAESFGRMSAPAIGELIRAVMDEGRTVVIPPPIARRLYERNGAFHGMYGSVYKDKDGVIRGEWSPAMRVILPLAGLSVAASSAGRIENHLDKGNTSGAVLDWLGFGRVYDARSPFEGDYRRLREAERYMVDTLEQLRFNEHGQMTPWLPDASPVEVEAFNEHIRATNEITTQLSDLFNTIRRLEGRGKRERGTQAIGMPEGPVRVGPQ